MRFSDAARLRVALAYRFRKRDFGMKRGSWILAWACVLSGSSVGAQQFRPSTPWQGEPTQFAQQPAFGPRGPQAAPGYGQAAPGYGHAPAGFRQDLELGGGYQDWSVEGTEMPPRGRVTSSSPTAADASRAVADQLRQQYHQTVGRDSSRSSASPMMPGFDGNPPLDRRPTYLPASTSRPARRDDGVGFDTVVEPRPAMQPAPAGQYGSNQPTWQQDVAPSYAPGQPMSPAGQPMQPQPMGMQPGMPAGMQPGGHAGMPMTPGYGCDDDCGPYEMGMGSDMMYGDPRLGGRWQGRPGGRRMQPGPVGMYGQADCATGDCATGDCATGYATSPGSGQSRLARYFGTCGREMFTVVGARWLYMRQDGADYKSLGYEAGMPSNTLLVEHANIGPQSGIEAFIVRQDQNGRGWEARYWGLESRTAAATLGNMPVTQLTGLNAINIGPWGTVGGLYDMADYHQVQRSSEFHSFEWNLINHASTCGGGNMLYRGLLGLRVMRFRDALNYSAYSSTGFGFGFDQLTYSLLTRNTFVGVQAGGAGEYCLTDRLRLSLGANAGVGQVFIDADQEIRTSTGVVATHPAGGNFSYMNTADNLAVFGELDARVYYHLSCNWRLSAGYRVLGLTGVALAPQQIPYAFTDVAELNSVKRDGGLLLHGLTVGAEFSF